MSRGPRETTGMNIMNAVQSLQTRLDGMAVGRKLSLAFGLVLSLAAALGLSALLALSQLNSASRQLADKWLPTVGQLAKARAALLEMRDWEVKHAHAADASYRAEYEDKIAAAQKAWAQALAEHDAIPRTDEERAAMTQLRKGEEEYLKFQAQVIKLGREDKGEDARDISDGAAKMSADDLVAALDKVVEQAFASGTGAADHAAGVYAKARMGVWALLGVALLLGLGMAAAMSRSLLRQLGGQPALAVQVATAVAAGDLGTRIPLRAGDASSLLARLAAMQTALATVVGSVRSNAEAVASASAQIALGNQDLSSRTEMQASALEETSATAIELGQTVQQNAENAGRAASLADEASQVAARGGEVVHQVVDTMKGIHASARKISDIIGVIDGIAFQTNILALNAAVEAARAGEQGRGFAVVAGEVRSLAQRSAEAAKEIKRLITDSVERVERGSSLADQAGETMNEVVQAIRSVTGLVGEISAASQEQSQGIAQVSEAVAQMDQGTQQNAALVEQSAAAAESLREQATVLVEAVAVFRT